MKSDWPASAIQMSPFLAKVIQKVLGKEVKLFESGIPVANELKRRLQQNLNNTTSTSQTNYYSSEPEKAQPIFDLLLNKKTTIHSFIN